MDDCFELITLVGDDLPDLQYTDYDSFGVQQAISVSFNRGWINGVMDAKYQIHDIGFAKGRGNVPGPWYEAELQEVTRRQYQTHKLRIK
ncbi:hypothetical protein ACFO4O_15230 [Glaciecola siphonariae]|uniref:Uncharacterized protein n=1 Tax=Glaciecola siphonariae TaxID=521012 RepID=A0ABV9LZE1_9ALTE